MRFLTSLEFGVGFLVASIITWGMLQLGASTGSGLSVGRCSAYIIDSTNDDWYVASSGKTFVVQLEPDTASTGTGTQVSLYGCTDEATNECAEYYFDSDGDGADDTNVLTGESWPSNTRWVRIRNVAGYILFDATAYSDDAKLVVCGAE